jgi:antitoxin CptB
MTETRETRLKRLKIRSWRRGTREMDMLLGPFFDARAEDLDDATLDTYEALLSENDQDLYAWISGRDTPPDALTDLLDIIRAHAAETHDALR